ncbi:MAG TPA: Rnase Y domain-containing protein, partial [Spirochaetota bacterium]|nr:Rnase Y domain-containing protein [Spirochaetota bacterium]
MNIGIILLVSVATGVVGYMARSYLGKIRLRSSEAQAQRIIQDAKREAEAKRKELLLEAKDQLLQEKNLLEKEMRERRQEITNIEKRYMQKEENLDAKVNQVEKREKEIEVRESDVSEKEAELTKEFERYLKELERISGLTQDQAKAQLMKSLEDNARFEALKIVNKIEEEARRSADKKAKDIVIQSIQRNVTEFTSENTVTAVTLPSDDMKGRIIGREGRNIRTLESLTGVDMIIDDTPEVVVISGYDPVRREIARLALERLIQNGRIHPARIEEVVEKVKLELEESMVDEGEKYAFELGIP